MSLPTIKTWIQRAIVVLSAIVALLGYFVADGSTGSLHDVAHWVSIVSVVLSGVIAFLKTEEEELAQANTAPPVSPPNGS